MFVRTSGTSTLTGVGRAGRGFGVTVIVVALRRRTIVALYSSFPQLCELKLLDRNCIPTIEVVISFSRNCAIEYVGARRDDRISERSGNKTKQLRLAESER